MRRALAQCCWLFCTVSACSAARPAAVSIDARNPAAAVPPPSPSLSAPSPTPLPWIAPPSEFPDTRLQAVGANGRALLATLLPESTNWAIVDAGVRVSGQASEPNRGLLIRDLEAAYPDLAASIVTVETKGRLPPVTLDLRGVSPAALLELVAEAAHVDVAFPSGLPVASISVRSVPADTVADAIAELYRLRRVEEAGIWLFVPPVLDLPDIATQGPRLSLRVSGLPAGTVAALVADAGSSVAALPCSATERIETLTLHRRSPGSVIRALTVSAATAPSPPTGDPTCLPAPWEGRVEELVGATAQALVTGEQGVVSEALVRTADGRLLRIVSGHGPVEIDDDSISVGGERIYLFPPDESSDVSLEDFFTHTDRFRLAATVVDPGRSFAIVEDRNGESGAIPDRLRFRQTFSVRVSDGALGASRRGEDFPAYVLRLGATWPVPQETAPPHDKVRDLETAIAAKAGECAKDDAEARDARRRLEEASGGPPREDLAAAAAAATARAEDCSNGLQQAMDALREYRENEMHPMELAVSYSPLDLPDAPPAGLWFVRTFEEKQGWLPSPALADRYSGDSWGDTLAIELDARLRKLDLRSRLLGRKLDPAKVDALLASDLTWECGGTIESLKVVPAAGGTATLQVRYRLRREIQDELRVVQAGRVSASSEWHQPPTEKDLRDLFGRAADALADRLVQQVPADALAGRN